MKIRQRIAASVAVLGGVVVAGSANAAGFDFSTITAGVDSSSVVTAIVAMGVILVGPGFAKWATKKVAGFFG